MMSAIALIFRISMTPFKATAAFTNDGVLSSSKPSCFAFVNMCFASLQAAHVSCNACRTIRVGSDSAPSRITRACSSSSSDWKAQACQSITWYAQECPRVPSVFSLFCNRMTVAPSDAQFSACSAIGKSCG